MQTCLSLKTMNMSFNLSGFLCKVSPKHEQESIKSAEPHSLLEMLGIVHSSSLFIEFNNVLLLKSPISLIVFSGEKTGLIAWGSLSNQDGSPSCPVARSVRPRCTAGRELLSSPIDAESLLLQFQYKGILQSDRRRYN